MSFWKAALIEAALITSFAVLKITGVGEKLWDFVKNGFDKAAKSMGGFDNMLTMDLETIMGAGTTLEMATAIGTVIAGAIGAGNTSWQIGTAFNDSRKKERQVKSEVSAK